MNEGPRGELGDEDDEFDEVVKVKMGPDGM